MAAEDRELDARAFREELTPLPELGPSMSPEAADLAVAQATCKQLQMANAALQARNDQLHEDRRKLAALVQSLGQQVKKLKEKRK